jgi:hypothetical protein
MSRREILALPPVTDLVTTGRALDGLSEPTIRALDRSGRLDELGIKVVKLGAQRKVITASLWAFLGISPDGADGGDTRGPQGQHRRAQRRGRRQQQRVTAAPTRTSGQGGRIGTAVNDRR